MRCGSPVYLEGNMSIKSIKLQIIAASVSAVCFTGVAISQSAIIFDARLATDGTCTSEAPLTVISVGWHTNNPSANLLAFYILDADGTIVGGKHSGVPSRAINGNTSFRIRQAPVGGLRTIVVDDIDDYGDADHLFRGVMPVGGAYQPTNELARYDFGENTLDPDCETTDSIFPLEGEFRFEQDVAYPSPSNNHSLVFQSYGNLVVYENDNAGNFIASQPVWELSILTNDRWRENEIALFQADGNLATYAEGMRYIWSARDVVSPAGSRLFLTEEGYLQIIAPSGEVLWNGGRHEGKG